MSDDTHPRVRTSLRFLFGLFIAIVLVGLLPHFIPPSYTPSRGGEAVAGTVNLVFALQEYHTRYGHWPDFTGDGLFLDEQRQAQLMRVLLAKDAVNNPRKILFIELPTATESHSHYHAGIDPKTDAFIDPWGQPYRIALDTTGTGTITNPDPDGVPIHASVIAWSLGKDGQQGVLANPGTLRGSDDVTSWQ